MGGVDPFHDDGVDSLPYAGFDGIYAHDLGFGDLALQSISKALRIEPGKDNNRALWLQLLLFFAAILGFSGAYYRNEFINHCKNSWMAARDSYIDSADEIMQSSSNQFQLHLNKIFLPIWQFFWVFINLDSIAELFRFR